MLCERRRLAAKNFLSNIFLDPVNKEILYQNETNFNINSKTESLKGNSKEEKDLHIDFPIVNYQSKSQVRYLWTDFKNKIQQILHESEDLKNKTIALVSNNFDEPSMIISSIIPCNINQLLISPGLEEDLKKGTSCGLIFLPNQDEFLVKQPNLFLSSFCPVGEEEISLISIIKSDIEKVYESSEHIPNDSRSEDKFPNNLSATSKKNFPNLTSNQINAQLDSNSFDIFSHLPPLCYMNDGSKHNKINNILKGPMCFFMLNDANNKCPHGHSLLFTNNCSDSDWIRFIQLMNNDKSTEQIIDYPDPLILYDPSLLDDFNNVLGTDKMTLTMPSYRSTVLLHTKHNDYKRNINRKFHESFPAIQLTLSKFRSLKRNMTLVIIKLNLDAWILATGFVLFEKLILKLMIDRVNRKACAASCLLIAAKLNDIKGENLTNLIQDSESVFRISRSDIFKTELAVTVALKFQLIPSDAEIIPHLHAIEKKKAFFLGVKSSDNFHNTDQIVNHQEYLRSLSSVQTKTNTSTNPMKYVHQLSYSNSKKN